MIAVALFKTVESMLLFVLPSSSEVFVVGEKNFRFNTLDSGFAEVGVLDELDLSCYK